MDILITGDLTSATRPLFQQLTEHHSVVAASPDLPETQAGNRVTLFSVAPNDEQFEKIFNSYNFRIVLFFGHQLHTPEDDLDDFRQLGMCLKICAKHDVKQVLYFQEKIKKSADGLSDSDIETMFQACKALCSYYCRHRGMSVVLCNIPSLYGYDECSSVVGDVLRQVRTGGAAKFLGEKDQKIPLLSQKDMGELLLRMVDSWPRGYDVLDIPAGEILTFEELGQVIKSIYPTARLSYVRSSVVLDPEFSSKDVRFEYDWLPIIGISDDIQDVVNAIGSSIPTRRYSVKEKIKKFLKKHEFVIQCLELSLAFLAMEILNSFTKTNVQFRYIDFRLLFVVMMGTIYGIKIGLIAAVLANISLLAAMAQSHNNWSAVVYDVNTWIPFIFIFIVGSVTGYIRDRLTNDNKFLVQEKQTLEEKYALLNDFYNSALENKNKYKTQIVSYRNSFGRLFDVTRHLDSTVVDEVFNEALNGLQDILDNRSVCIYSFPDPYYGRLMICSKEVSNVVSKSMKLSNFSEMADHFQDGEVWVNRNRLSGYPEYAMPIYHEDRFIALITLQSATYEQMGVYYENLIRVVSGLIKISLVRAIEYSNKISDEMYIPGTKVMTQEYFSKIIRIREDMVEKGVSEYTLLHFHTTPESLVSVSEKISKVIRATDVMGIGKDGDLYLALSQANESNVQFVLNRLTAVGVYQADT